MKTMTRRIIIMIKPVASLILTKKDGCMNHDIVIEFFPLESPMYFPYILYHHSDINSRKNRRHEFEIIRHPSFW